MTRTRPRTRLLGGAVGVALIVVVALRTIGLLTVVTPSMQPELAVGDRVLVNKLVPEIVPLRRGDVAVFEDPGGWAEASARSRGAITHDTLIVKRVIGVGGDRVVCCAPDGALVLNGRPLAEPYASRRPFPLAFDVVVPDGSYWMMGDDRVRSFDSSGLADASTHGFVPTDRIVGRVEVTL
ncbi:signal peptidase I [Solirubrobacter sp. CPCC 204708]|uniref:Signal peptidase I n=1 Tax=Solirubrobacter deserti TaxID=2282478 RepID=A0ABT4RTI9_9ACTN|nr:signal peptidase I [Solirubrobacter deserti]MBE2320754.1 signal peptidase I [Solirubrobacter deserti]MDA0141856.1 signal peptidase I [Solirubrobacter deserti]